MTKAADLSVVPEGVKPEDEAAYQAKVAHITGANLPVIIDSLGEYRTRAGTKVIIDRIDTPDLATFNCKGTLLLKKRKGTGFIPRYQIWQPNGRNLGLGESQRDIVAKL